MTTAFASLADIEERHPAELITLAADEQTGLRDDVRIERAIEDAGAEIRGILKARYSGADFERLDSDSLATLKLYSIDIALYRIALAFDRSNERIEERYKMAIKRLEAISSGKGGLSFEGQTAGANDLPATETSPNEVLIDAPDRMFTRDRMKGL